MRGERMSAHLQRMARRQTYTPPPEARGRPPAKEPTGEQTYTEKPTTPGPRIQFSKARMAAVRAERDRRIAEGRVEPDGVRRADEEGGT